MWRSTTFSQASAAAPGLGRRLGLPPCRHPTSAAAPLPSCTEEALQHPLEVATATVAEVRPSFLRPPCSAASSSVHPCFFCFFLHRPSQPPPSHATWRTRATSARSWRLCWPRCAASEPVIAFQGMGTPSLTGPGCLRTSPSHAPPSPPPSPTADTATRSLAPPTSPLWLSCARCRRRRPRAALRTAMTRWLRPTPAARRRQPTWRAHEACKRAAPRCWRRRCLVTCGPTAWLHSTACRLTWRPA